MHFWNFVYFEIQLFNLNSYEFTKRVWIRSSCFFFFLLLKRVKTKVSINCSISIYLANNLEQKQKLLGFLVKRKRVRAFKERKKKKKYPVIKRHNTPWACTLSSTGSAVWTSQQSGKWTTMVLPPTRGSCCVHNRSPVFFHVFQSASSCFRIPAPFPPNTLVYWPPCAVI